MRVTRVKTASLLSVLGCLASANPTQADTPPAPSITPPHVYAKVSLLRSELELIRFDLGRPHARNMVIHVEDAAPREVYFQALTLLKKINRLSFEILRTPPVTVREIERCANPEHVYAVVGLAMESLLAIKAELGITVRSAEPSIDPTKRPTDVFLAIMRAGRQLDTLMESPFFPRDTFQQVTQALGYVATLRGSFAGHSVPATQALQRGATPVDVCKSLVGCYKTLGKLAELSGVSTLRYDHEHAGSESADSSHNYDLASLIVSELAYIHSLREDAGEPYEGYPPGRKVPAQVVKRAAMLQSQLQELAELAEQHPQWLKGLNKD